MEQPKPPSWQDHGGQPSPSKPPRIASSLSAKVARLTAELEAMRANRDEWAQIDKAEIAKLREDLQRLRDGAPDNALAAKDAEIARLRAALDKEREVCDEARRLVGVPNPFDPKWNEDMRAWCDRYSARRAAEAKEPR